MADSYIGGRDYIGGLVGESRGSVRNCTYNGTVTGDMQVGGIVGRSEGTVKDCTNNGAVSGESRVAGIVGENFGTVTGCTNNGSISGGDNLGGIVGYNDIATVTYCHNSGAVSAAPVPQVEYAGLTGGVVGANQMGSVICCSNDGTVTATGDGNYNVGGLVGMNSSTVTDCFNTAAVSGAECVGGVVGCNSYYTSYNGTVTGCYNIGTVNCTSFYGGGVVGANAANMTNNYYLDTAAAGGMNGSDTQGSAESKTAEQFASGEVAYLLNGSTSAGEPVWKQTLGTDKLPGFTGDTVYYGYLSCGDAGMIYTNDPTASAQKPEHTFDENGVCDCTAQAVAKIGDTYDVTLAEAAENVTQGATVHVLTDVTVSEGETVTFAAFAKLDVAEGKKITCGGTVKIGEADGIIYENTLYYYGGDRTNDDWQDFQYVLQPTCWTAGEGHVTYDPETNTLSLHNATSTFYPDSESIGCLEYADRNATKPMTINFRGVNTLTSEYRHAIWVQIPVTMNGIGANAVLNVIGLETSRSQPCCAFSSGLTVNGGTVNIRADYALNSPTLTVASGAELNAAGGYDPSGIYYVLTTGEITGDGTVNALAIDGSAVTETVEIPYVVYGSAALENDLRLSDMYAGTIDEGRLGFGFTVPEGATLTVNEGVTLDLSDPIVKHIDFTGTVINNGVILLPEGFDIENAPKSGKVRLGGKSYTWNSENNGWSCDTEESHVGGTTTCLSGAVCDVCGTVYTEPLTHEMDPATGLCRNGCEKLMAAAAVNVHENTTYYESLSGAIDAAAACAAEDGAVVRLLQDITLTETQAISGGVFTLDLNGKSIKSTAAQSAAAQMSTASTSPTLS